MRLHTISYTMMRLRGTLGGVRFHHTENEAFVSTSSVTTFARDRYTLLAYAMLGYFAYLQAAPGVAMPLLRDDLGLNYTVGGMHISALALGMVLAGLLADRAVARWGRRTVFWGGGGGMAVGALLLVVGQHPAITIAGMFLMGLLGTALLATIQSGLADRHGTLRAIALTESNVVAAVITILPPLLVGGFERIGIGWRGAFVAMVLAWGVAYLTQRDVDIPASRPRKTESGGTDRALPPIFWLYWAALVSCVAVEWSVIAWSADFMTEAGGLDDDAAALVMTLFFLAMALGRVLGSQLTRRMDVVRLLFAAMSVGLAGFVTFWLAPVLPLLLGGLFVAGLGIANLFPFLLSITVGTAPEQSDVASSRITLGAGLAILLAPQILGTVADQTGIQTAYGLVFVLFVLAMIIVTAARRRAVAAEVA
jgi:MFS family permease